MSRQRARVQERPRASESRRTGARSTAWAARGLCPWRLTSAALLAEDPDLDVVLLLVDVDREVAELVDELVDVLGLDLAQIESQAALAESEVHALLGLGWDQARQPDASPQEHQRDANIDLDRTLARLVAVDNHAKVLGPGGFVRLGAVPGRG